MLFNLHHLKIGGKVELSKPLEISEGEYSIEGDGELEIIAKAGCAFNIKTGGVLNLKNLTVTTEDKDKALINAEGGELNIVSTTLRGGMNCLLLKGTKVSVKDSSIIDANGTGLKASSSKIILERSTIKNNRGNGINVHEKSSIEI